MVGAWFLERARDRKDRKKGELRSEGLREKSTVIVGRGAEPPPVVAMMFEDGVTRVVGHESFTLRSHKSPEWFLFFWMNEI